MKMASAKFLFCERHEQLDRTLIASADLSDTNNE